MAVTVHCTSVVVNANGRIYVNFASGDQREFASLTEMAELAGAVDSEDAHPTVQMMLIRWWLAQDPEAADVSLIAGRQLTFDLSALPSPMFIQDLGS